MKRAREDEEFAEDVGRRKRRRTEAGNATTGDGMEEESLGGDAWMRQYGSGEPQSAAAASVKVRLIDRSDGSITLELYSVAHAPLGQTKFYAMAVEQSTEGGTPVRYSGKVSDVGVSSVAFVMSPLQPATCYTVYVRAIVEWCVQCLTFQLAATTLVSPLRVAMKQHASANDDDDDDDTHLVSLEESLDNPRQSTRQDAQREVAEIWSNLQCLVSRLRVHPNITVVQWRTFDAVTDEEVAAVERALHRPLPPALESFWRHSNGVQLAWVCSGDGVQAEQESAAGRRARGGELRIPSLFEVLCEDRCELLHVDWLGMSVVKGFNETQRQWSKRLRVLDFVDGDENVVLVLEDKPRWFVMHGSDQHFYVRGLAMEFCSYLRAVIATSCSVPLRRALFKGEGRVVVPQEECAAIEQYFSLDLLTLGAVDSRSIIPAVETSSWGDGTLRDSLEMDVEVDDR